MLPQRVYAKIDLDAICRNIKNAMDKVGKETKVMAIIKTDAYGHGAVAVAKALSLFADEKDLAETLGFWKGTLSVFPE